MATEQKQIMHTVSEDSYRAENGYTATRGDAGTTPNGNPLSGLWALRSPDGKLIDFDQYRHDLFERNGFRPPY